MYKDYQDAILRHYEEKRANNDLSSTLLNPSPSKLRDECAFIYKSRFVKTDLKILSSFFEVHDGSNILKAIEGIDIDKFRPLANFLKEATGKTDNKNIELLGWLLDFQPRPHDKHYDYQKSSISTTKKSPIDLPQAITKGGMTGEPIDFIPPVNTPVQPVQAGDNRTGSISRGFIKRVGVILGGVIMASGLIAAVIFNNKDDKGCMVWTGDHYERVSCDSSGGMGLVLGLDGNSVRHLRRITRPDTLTEKDIGKVWYRKRGIDSLDFYTTGGRDPVDPNLDLKRLRAYIFNKYLKKNK